MAWVIAFVSQKGGVGKSTLSRALAREATTGGLKTKIGDLDIQQSTSESWHRRRLAAGVEPYIPVETFGTVIQALKNKEDYDLLILDGPARASAGTLAIAKEADLIVQPSGASLDDLEPAIKVFHALVKEGIPKSKLVFGLTRVGTDAEEQEARDYIQEAGYTVLEGCLVERPAYRQAQNKGYAVTETSFKGLNQRADQIIQSLINKVGENG